MHQSRAGFGDAKRRVEFAEETGQGRRPPGTAIKSGLRRAEKTEAEEEKGERQRVRLDDAKVPVLAGAVAPSRCFVTIDASD